MTRYEQYIALRNRLLGEHLGNLEVVYAVFLVDLLIDHGRGEQFGEFRTEGGISRHTLPYQMSLETKEATLRGFKNSTTASTVYNELMQFLCNHEEEVA